MICQFQKQSILKNATAQCCFVAATLLPDLYTRCNDLAGKFLMEKICQFSCFFTIQAASQDFFY